MDGQCFPVDYGHKPQMLSMNKSDFIHKFGFLLIENVNKIKVLNMKRIKTEEFIFRCKNRNGNYDEIKLTNDNEIFEFYKYENENDNEFISYIEINSNNNKEKNIIKVEHNSNFELKIGQVENGIYKISIFPEVELFNF